MKMRRFAVWSVMPVTVILVVGAEAAGVSARDGRLVRGGDSIAEAATHRTAPEHLTRPDGREETLAALRFRWPVYGPISSDFGAPRASRTGFHAGVDIGASRGTFVRAPAGGTVAFVGWRSGYGRTIVIDHGHQISTLYGHLAKPDVVRGQTVEEGAGIGLIGATGHASGPHLHYEVLVNGRPVNPRLVFARPQDIDGRSRVAARGREEVNEAAQRLRVELVRGITPGSARSHGVPSSEVGNVCASTSTPASIATRAPGLFEGCANTSLPRRWPASAAAFATSSGIRTIERGVAQDPVKSLTMSAPPASSFSTRAASSGRASSGTLAGRM